MGEVIEIGDLAIDVTRKDVKNVHLSVHPPDGRVTLVAPTSTRIDVARAYAITKIGWIRQQQGKLAQQAREAPRQFVGRETHYLWGRRHLLRVTECEGKPVVRLDHRTIHLQVRPGSTLETRAKVDTQLAPQASSRRGPPLDQEVGKPDWCRSPRLFPAAHEDQMGKLQRGTADHSSEYGVGQETPGFAGVRRGSRDDPYTRTDP